jgi:CheY-like chemotaxis protein
MRKTFLLADDDSDDADMFQEALCEIDPSIIFFHSPHGKDALNKMEEGVVEPNVIFLDLNMPVMNGLQCLTKLKTIQTLKDIPVIIYSTASSKKEVSVAIRLGALCFFTKPSDYNILKKTLKVVADNLHNDLPKALGGTEGMLCG